MSQLEKSKQKLLSHQSDNNWDFDEFINLIKHLGFAVRKGKGSHRSVCTKPGIPIAVSVQPRDGHRAKSYQVRQFRDIVVNFNL